MKTTKKFLAVLLSVLMLFSSVAFVASADNDRVRTETYFEYDPVSVKSITDVSYVKTDVTGFIDIYFTATLNEGYTNPQFWHDDDYLNENSSFEFSQNGYVYECIYRFVSVEDMAKFANRDEAYVVVLSWDREIFDIHLINSRFDEESDSYHVFWDGMPYGSTPEYDEPESYRTEDGGIYEFIGWDIAVDGEFDGKVDAKKIENVKGDIYADAVFANVHDHNSNPGDENSCWELKEIVKATCTEDGAYKYICGKCSEGVTKEVPIPSRGGHTMSPWTEVIAPTCTKSGYRVCMCMNIVETDLYKACDHREFENVNPIDHSYGEWKTVLEPTCTEKGRAERVCTRKGCDAKQYKDIDPIGHNYGEWVTVLEPTCTEKGQAERVCKNDASHKEYKDLDATGKHIDNDGDKRCDHCGEEFGHCSDCICHQGNILSYVMRYLCTFLSKVFHTELKCCECMEWYNGNISSIS